MSAQCCIDGCERDCTNGRRGMCVMHYTRARRRHELPPKPGPFERLMARVVQLPGSMDTPCWIPSYGRNKEGYASNGELLCHRVAYEALVGPVPDAHELDHICRNRACCNPEHLEPVTHRENCLRGEHRSIITYRTDICQRGHSMENAYINPRGNHRRCRECMAEFSRQRDRHQAGVCPCCNRMQSYLSRHLAKMHPDFEATP